MAVYDASSSKSYYLILSVLASLFVLRVGIVVYRVWFHPLAKIPGPRLAAATSFYSFWWNAFHRNFYLQIEKLHTQYGPVIRIGPNEVHLSNSDHHDTIHGYGSIFTKPAEFYKLTGTSSLGTPSNELHRTRRAIVNPFFSRRKVLALEDIVQLRVSKLLSRMHQSFQNAEPFNVHFGFRAVSVDVISDYAFGSSYNLLDTEDMGKSYFEMMASFGASFHWSVQFPIIETVVDRSPKWLTRFIEAAKFKNGAQKQILEVKKSVAAGEKLPERPTIFHQLLDPNTGADVGDRSVDHLVTEGMVILAAATDTVGATLVTAVYGVYSNPEIYQKVLAELADTFPDANAELEFLKLEKLPYLTAIIKEALRTALPVPGRIPRKTPASGAEFDGFGIPPGTNVSMSMYQIHRDAKIFPSPEKFNPDRWLGSAEQNQRLDKYLVAWGKGARNCLGMPLAYCELYVMLGTMFRRCGFLGLSEMRKEDWMFEDNFTATWKGRQLHVIKTDVQERKL